MSIKRRTLPGFVCLTLAVGCQSPAAPRAGQPARAEQERPLETRKPLVLLADSRTGIEHVVLCGVDFRCGKDGAATEPRRASLDMMPSTVLRHSFIPACVAEALNAETVGQVELVPAALPNQPDADAHQVDEPEHLRVIYGMNRSAQRRFRVVRIDRVDLGVGPTFGPVTALVSADENSAIGLIGRDWLQQSRDAAGFVITTDAVHFRRRP